MCPNSGLEWVLTPRPMKELFGHAVALGKISEIG